MRRLLPGIVGLMALSQVAFAQDAHFSQYFSSPLTLNPALTGLTQCDLRVTGNYRSQWGAISANPYTTFTGSYDMNLFRDEWDNGNSMGVGVIAMYDKAGNGGLTNMTFGLSGAYHLGLGQTKNHTVSLGVQGYLVQKSIDFSKLQFGDQYGNLPTGETFNNSDLTYPDLNAGIMYTGKLSDYATAYAGFSTYHLFRPVESFKSTSGNTELNKIHRRYSITAGGTFDLNENISLLASGLYQTQANSSEFLLGAAAGFVLNPGYDREYSRPTTFYLGGWYRVGDAFIPYVAIETKKIRVGFSYDFTVSNLAVANKSNGAYEVSLIFNGCINKRDRVNSLNYACPTF